MRAALVLIGKVWKRKTKDQKKLVLPLDTLVLLPQLMRIKARYDPDTFRNCVQFGNKQKVMKPVYDPKTCRNNVQCINKLKYRVAFWSFGVDDRNLNNVCYCFAPNLQPYL